MPVSWVINTLFVNYLTSEVFYKFLWKTELKENFCHTSKLSFGNRIWPKDTFLFIRLS